MPYLWNKFNIKTFPANTVVFVDGVFKPELSETNGVLEIKDNNIIIDKESDLPVHIIHVGEITGLFKINCEISAPDTTVFLTTKLSTKTAGPRQHQIPAFLNIFIKNTGKNSIFNGKVLAQNYGWLEINEKAGHFAENTDIFISNKIVAHSGSETKLSGIAEIAPGYAQCKSDINFAAMAADDAKILFSPNQRISTIPASAAHSASIWRGSDAQIEYLRTAGLSGAEIKKVLEEAFTNDFA